MEVACRCRINRLSVVRKVGEEDRLEEEGNRSRNKICRCTDDIGVLGQGSWDTERLVRSNEGQSWLDLRLAGTVDDWTIRLFLEYTT